MADAHAAWSRTNRELEEWVPKARAEDVASPEAIVTALHDSVNGPKGAWNSDRLRSLCVPNVLFACLTVNEDGETTVNNCPLDDFIRLVEEKHAESGWYERTTEIVSVSTVAKKGGALAVVHYAGEASSTPDGMLEEQGETQAILMHDGVRWWVVADTW
ncbi:hypothetical protein [Kutzneria buriramensis]|uniref:DUF4440 domain-containing protein n=1 Tax=Kutzneria buriramensis TaxID=1045776 RepID=A0A3E0H0Q3_9PSEU|nr:hypothetical protein [Kutzneria buriramensis]REH35191.1 hypothetical protein BCF44_11851 [Kutzneria buriramensis]